MIYIISWLGLMLIYLTRKKQITLLIAKKVKIPDKYLEFLDSFSKKKVFILSEVIKLKLYSTKL